MKIFVTGGTGFIGSHFLNAAHEGGHEIVALRRPGSRPRIPMVREPTWLDSEMAAVGSDVLRGCDALVHLAAAGVNPGQADWQELFQFNVSDSLSLWLKGVEAGIVRFVVCGSCFEYGKSGERYGFIPCDAPLEPTGPYHASKAAATMAALALAAQKNLELMVLRPFHVFGEGEASDRLWPSLRAAALGGMDFPMTNGAQVRDFIAVEQVAAAFLAALTRKDLSPGNPGIENIGSGNPVTLRDFATFWWKHWHAKGALLFGALPHRPNEVMRYVPEVNRS